MRNKLPAPHHRLHSSVFVMKTVLWVGWIAIGLNVWLIME